MEHIIYSDIADMVQQEILAGQTSKICLEPFETAGYSSTDSAFLTVDDCDVDEPRFVIKQLREERDWVMQATGDDNWRAVRVWQYGLLDRMPGTIEHGTLGCAFDENGYALLMQNLSRTLLPDGPISEQDHFFILNAMAELHAAFWNDEFLKKPALNLCTLEHFLSHTSHSKIQPISTKNDVFVVGMILDGHRQLPKIVGTQLAEKFQNLANNPSPLCEALAVYPQTLVHSDFRNANLGIDRSDPHKLVLFDWARPIRTVPGIDLAYYLMMTTSADLPISFDKSIEIYKDYLAEKIGDLFSEDWWAPNGA